MSLFLPLLGYPLALLEVSASISAVPRMLDIRPDRVLLTPLLSSDRLTTAHHTLFSLTLCLLLLDDQLGILLFFAYLDGK